MLTLARFCFGSNWLIAHAAESPWHPTNAWRVGKTMITYKRREN